MKITMDTDAVRAMASRLRQTADSMDASLTSIKSSVESAGWQSQAREEFIMQLETIRRYSTQSNNVLRLMSQAADQKASQWEAIANVFNGPFHFIGGIWNSVKGFFGGLGNNFLRAINIIRLPSLPKFVLPSISGAVIIGGISSIIPQWEWKPPNWWPFQPDGPGIPTTLPHKPGEETPTPKQMPQPIPPKNIAVETPARNLTSPKLQEVTGDPSSYTCATYAKARRPDLGSTQSNREKYADGAAANYINKFEDTAFQIDGNSSNLQDSIGKGYALVWEPDHPSANDTYGHVAIVEEVYADHIIISEATSWPDGIYKIKERKISIDQLNNSSVWLIP